MRRVERGIQHLVRRHAAEGRLRASTVHALVLDTGSIPSRAVAFVATADRRTADRRRSLNRTHARDAQAERRHRTWELRVEMRCPSHFPLPIAVRIGNAGVGLTDHVALVEILEHLDVQILADPSSAAVQQHRVEQLRRQRMHGMEVIVEASRRLRMTGRDETLHA